MKETCTALASTSLDHIDNFDEVADGLETKGCKLVPSREEQKKRMGKVSEPKIFFLGKWS